MATEAEWNIDGKWDWKVYWNIPIDKDVFASQKRIIVDPQSTGYPIPYLIDSGKVEKISVYASTYMEQVRILS